MNSRLGNLIGLIFYKVFSFFDKIIFVILRRSPILYLNDKLFDKVLNNNGYKFVTPNATTYFRAKTLFTKEEETIEWINSFEVNSVFWDIGANIGLYSVYAAKHKNCDVFSFEPSPLNLKCLSRNICANNLTDKIFIIPNALSNKANLFANFKENSNIDGSALNTFGVKYDYQGKIFKKRNYNFKILGTSIDYILKTNKNILLPDYVKIDVDGIEHLILNGGLSLVSNPKVKEFQIEVSENFKEQKNTILKIMKDNGFSLKSKRSSLKGVVNNEYLTRNYLFIR
tara:strand:- start:12294 stop:13145 length:852 start_codon:yes stop_codon:yes gene_type:complete